MKKLFLAMVFALAAVSTAPAATKNISATIDLDTATPIGSGGMLFDFSITPLSVSDGDVINTFISFADGKRLSAQASSIPAFAILTASAAGNPIGSNASLTFTGSTPAPTTQTNIPLSSNATLGLGFAFVTSTDPFSFSGISTTATMITGIGTQTLDTLQLAISDSLNPSIVAAVPLPAGLLLLLSGLGGLVLLRRS